MYSYIPTSLHISPQSPHNLPTSPHISCEQAISTSISAYVSTLPEGQIQLLTNGITEEVVRPPIVVHAPPPPSRRPTLPAPSLPPTPAAAVRAALPPALPPAHRPTADAARVRRWERCVCWSATS